MSNDLSGIPTFFANSAYILIMWFPLLASHCKDSLLIPMSKNAKSMIIAFLISLPTVDVLTYMTRANRPFSVNDVVSALQKTHGKTVWFFLFYIILM